MVGIKIKEGNYKSFNKAGYGIAGIIAFIGIWVLVSLQLGPVRLPSPWQVLKVFFIILNNSRALSVHYSSWSTGIIPHILMSLLKLVAGSIIGIISGVLIGFIMSSSRFILGLLDLPTRVLRAIPPLAFIPFILVWFGTGITQQIFLIALYNFIILLTNTIEAVRHVKPAYLGFAASLGANRLSIFRNVVLPACIPEILAGIRVVATFSWGLVIVAELVGGSFGIGRVISFMIPLMLTDEIIAVILWIAIVAFILDLLLLRLDKNPLKYK